jgi:hypothetical protein
VLAAYMNDYFEKEITYVRHQYVALLRKAVEDTSPNGKVSSGTVFQLPQLKAEKMKSIRHIVTTVANKTFINSIFAVTTDAVTRMESIGRDDKKLAQHVKDIYLLQLGFCCEGLILPWSKSSIHFLLKAAGTKPPQSTLPPMELIPAIVALTYCKHRLVTHYQDIFQRPLSTAPNFMAACKDAKQKQFIAIRKTAYESIFAWTLAVASHFDKLLLTLQSKYDFQPVLEGFMSNVLGMNSANTTNTSSNHNNNNNNNNNNKNPMNVVRQSLVTTTTAIKSTLSLSVTTLTPTTACDAVCKAFLQVTNTIRRFESDILDIDLLQVFWKPFGQQFIGLLITHLRRQTINVEGSRQLLRDLEEYRHV